MDNLFLSYWIWLNSNSLHAFWLFGILNEILGKGYDYSIVFVVEGAEEVTEKGNESNVGSLPLPPTGKTIVFTPISPNPKSFRPGREEGVDGSTNRRRPNTQNAPFPHTLRRTPRPRLLSPLSFLCILHVHGLHRLKTIYIGCSCKLGSI